MSAPKHRANKIVREKPKVQLPGKHAGVYKPEPQPQPRHSKDHPLPAPVVRELSLADLMGAVVVPPHIRAMGRA